MGLFGGDKKKMLQWENFDPQLHYDIYYEAQQKTLVLRNVRVAGLRTWGEIDEDTTPFDGFMEFVNSVDAKVWIDVSSVYMICEAGTRPDVFEFRI